MRAEQIADHLHARPSGSGWIGHCPGPLHVHGDRNPSLSIREGQDGRILLYCHAGCSVESVCDNLKIRVADLFPTPGSYQPKPRAVQEAQRQIADLRSRLTPKDREREVTIIYVDRENLDEGMARCLALGVEGELVQAVLVDSQ